MFVLREKEIAEKNSFKRQFAKGISGTFALKISLTGLSFAIGIFLARVLDVKGYGVYSYCTAWIALLQVPAELGSRAILAREVAVYQSQSEWGLLKGLLLWMSRGVLAVSLGLTLLVAVGVWLYNGGISDPAIATFFLALVTLPLYTLIAARQGTMQGFRAVLWGQLPENLIQPLTLIVSVGIAYFLLGKSITVSQVMLLRSLAVGLSFAVGAMLLRRTLPQELGQVKASYDVKRWTRYLMPFMFISCTYVINARTDILMLGALDGPESAGVYAIASRGANFITFVLIAVNMSLSPAVSSLYANREMTKLQAVVSKGSRLIFWGSLPLTLILIAFNKWFLAIFGPGFVVGGTALSILAFGQMVNACAASSGMILDMTGYERYSAIGTGCTAVLNILLNFWLIPIYGLAGAAAATASSMAVRNLFLLFCVHKKIGIRSSVFGLV